MWTLELVGWRTGNSGSAGLWEEHVLTLLLSWSVQADATPTSTWQTKLVWHLNLWKSDNISSKTTAPHNSPAHKPGAHYSNNFCSKTQVQTRKIKLHNCRTRFQFRTIINKCENLAIVCMANKKNICEIIFQCTAEDKGKWRTVGGLVSGITFLICLRKKWK